MPYRIWLMNLIKKSIKYERSRALKIASFLAISLLIAFVGVVPFLRQANEQRAWNTIQNPKNSGVREALELLSQGCWARSWMPNFLATSLFGNCANLSGANLSGANLTYFAKLSGAKLSGANLSGADLSNAYLSRANLSRTNLTSANLFSADLSRANLTSANLTSAVLSADFRNADLTSANLTSAYLISTDLIGANLSDAKLSGAHLIGANFSDANLSRANLSGAKLSGVKLRSANLSDANLSGADLGCYTVSTEKLVCTDLKGVKNLTSQQIKAAKNWEQVCYNPELRRQLNLPPENPKICVGDLLK